MNQSNITWLAPYLTIMQLLRLRRNAAGFVVKSMKYT